MPIDDTLGAIYGKKEEDLSNFDLGSTNDERMVKMRAQARASIGQTLVDFFKNKLQGLRLSFTFMQNALNVQFPNDFHLPIIEKAGLELLTISPEKEMKFHAEFTYGLSEEIIKEVLTLAVGDYVSETDLCKKIIENNDAFFLMPEFYLIRSHLLNDISYIKPTLHPKLIVMGMEPQYRYLATLAIDEAIENKRCNVIEFNLQPKQIETYLYKTMPLTQDYLKVAKTYGITEIIPTITSYQKVCKEYANQWVIK